MNSDDKNLFNPAFSWHQAFRLHAAPMHQELMIHLHNIIFRTLNRVRAQQELGKIDLLIARQSHFLATVNTLGSFAHNAAKANYVIYE